MRTLLSIAVLAGASMPAFAVNVIPEPSTLALFALGAGGLLLLRRKK